MIEERREGVLESAHDVSMRIRPYRSGIELFDHGVEEPRHVVIGRVGIPAKTGRHG